MTPNDKRPGDVLHTPPGQSATTEQENDVATEVNTIPPPIDHRDIAGRALVARILADEAKKLQDECRLLLEPGLRPQEKVVGTLPDGTSIGTIQRTRASKTAAVTDEKALLEWVQEHRPDEVVHSVRESYIDALKKQVKKHGHAFDPQTGEVIPGIGEVLGNSSYRPEPDNDVRPAVMARLAELIRAGVLDAPVAIERGEVA